MLMNSRGDTIIEVLLAITVFSMVSVAAMTIMNQGTNAAQRALEVTLVRQQIDAQAEALRALQQSATAGYRTAWSQVAQHNTTGHYYDGPNTAETCPAADQLPSGSFILDPRNAAPNVSSPGNWFKGVLDPSSPPYAQLKKVSGTQQSYGIWIERDYSDGGTLPDLYTFTVNACWSAAGLEAPSKVDTVVRLYDPGT